MPTIPRRILRKTELPQSAATSQKPVYCVEYVVTSLDKRLYVVKPLVSQVVPFAWVFKQLDQIAVGVAEVREYPTGQRSVARAEMHRRR